VNQCWDDFSAELQDRAISLAMASGRQVDRQKFAIVLLQKLDVTYRQKFLEPEAVAKGDDPDSKIAERTPPRSTPGATSSPAPTTTRGKRAGKFRRA